MLYKIKLKNAKDTVLLDKKVYDYLLKDKYLSKVDFVNNLRKHSSGCAVFQKTQKKAGGGYKTETIYLHKLVAEKFLSKQKSRTKKLVGALNGNKLDCRISNLSWRSRSVASRQRKTSSKIGYTGVYKENNRYRAVISINRKSVHIGMFPTAKEAAEAYNKMSKKLYGKDGKLNEFGKKKVEKAPAAKLMTPPKKEKMPRAKRTTKAKPKKKAVAKKTTAKKSTAKKKTTAKKKAAPKRKTAAKKTTARKKTTAKKSTKKKVAKKVTAKKKAAPKKKTAAKKKKTTARKKK